MCLYRFVLYMREILAHIDIFKCSNVHLKIVAPAVSSILRARILTIDFSPTQLDHFFFILYEI